MATAGRHTHTHAHARTNSLTLPSSAPTLYSRFEGERTQLYNDCYQIKFDLETQAAEREEGTVLKAGIAAHDAGLLPPANSGVNLNKKIKPEAGWGPRMNLDGTVSGANSLKSEKKSTEKFDERMLRMLEDKQGSDEEQTERDMTEFIAIKGLTIEDLIGHLHMSAEMQELMEDLGEGDTLYTRTRTHTHTHTLTHSL
jgi:hypothetical protein